MDDEYIIVNKKKLYIEMSRFNVEDIKEDSKENSKIDSNENNKDIKIDINENSNESIMESKSADLTKVKVKIFVGV